MSGEHETHMRRALELAEKGRGRTSPNPMVGAVLIKDGATVGEGFHEKAGLPHAEIMALRAAGDSARGDNVAFDRLQHFLLRREIRSG